MSAPAHPILFFDGHCGLCSGFVQRLLGVDQRGVLRFAPLQSAFAKTRLAGAGMTPEQLEALDTVVLLDTAGRLHVKSDAVLEVARLLGGRWRWLCVGRVLPQGVRNWLYDMVARHRYRVFGQHESCWLPRPEWRGRFLGEA